MTKQLPLFLAVLVIICCGGFVQAQSEKPPYYLLMREDARQLLDSLQCQPQESNAFMRLVLLHNLSFSDKDKQARENAENIFENYFKKDTTAIIQAYGHSLKLLNVRDRNTAGNTWRLTKTFFGLFGDDPYEEANKAFRNLQAELHRDANNIQLRILSLSAAIETAEHLDGNLGYAYRDLKWLQDNFDRLDSTETFFYTLSWVKYAYKYSIIKEIPDEAQKGYIWLEYAEHFALSEVYCQEIYFWRMKLDSVEVKK